MKRMLMLLVAAMFCISMMGFAQSTDTYSQGSGQQTSAAPAGDHSHMKMDTQEMVNHLDQQLTLSADQKTKITTIVENSNKHAEQLMSSGGDQKATHDAMHQLHENTHAQIRATLNPDQQTKFDAMMKEQMSKHQKTTSTTTTTNSTTETPK